MGKYVSWLCPCFGRDKENKKDIETNYITPTPTTKEPDIESDTSNTYYIYDNL